MNITGGTLKLTNGAVALASYANIKISDANVSIENISGHALSAYIGDIEVVDTTFTLKNGGFDGAVTTSGNITVRGGKFTMMVQSASVCMQARAKMLPTAMLSLMALK